MGLWACLPIPQALRVPVHYLQEIGSFRSCFCSGAGLTTWLVTALGLGLMAGRADGIRFGLVLGLLLGFGLSIEETAWLRYVLSKGWLALHGRLPWSLMGFLGDARQRGVLRQAGAFYQFRHIELQHRLANRDTDKQQANSAAPTAADQ